MKTTKPYTATVARAALFSALVFGGCAEAQTVRGSGDTFRLTLDAPISTWDEAIPLGSGMLGGLLVKRHRMAQRSLRPLRVRS